MATINYKVGESYTLKPIETGKDSRDNDYISLLDDEGAREFRIYPQQIKFQEDELPAQVTVTVKSIDILGRVQFRLDEGRMIKEHYQEGNLYTFTITESHDDPNTKAHYYLVEDDFAKHRFYTAESDKYAINKECILKIISFNDKGFLKFEEPHVEHAAPEHIRTKEPEKKTPSIPQKWNKAPLLDIGEESTTLELKTSIVFPPEAEGPDIDKQLDTIIKVLCAFMNTEGGELYIGVHDSSKRVIGIAEDYEHLNEGNDMFSYRPNHDGYELKIRNTIDRKCNSLANSLIKIEFHDLEGYEYCKITVQKANLRPIWFNHTQIWIRQGNRLKQLKGDEISYFITDKMMPAVRKRMESEGNGTDIAIWPKEELEATLRKIINERSQVDISLPPPPALDEVDYWINWLDDGTWKRTREKATDRQYKIQVPVPKVITEPRILFCYESGAINCMELSVFRKNSKNDKFVMDKTWNLEAGAPIDILIASPTNLLVGYSIDYNGVQYVKFHDITDFVTTDRSNNKGRPFIPENYKMLSFRVIDGSYRKKIAHLQRTKAQRSNNPGEPINSQAFANEIAFLRTLLGG